MTRHRSSHLRFLIGLGHKIILLRVLFKDFKSFGPAAFGDPSAARARTTLETTIARLLADMDRGRSSRRSSRSRSTEAPACAIL
jgi:hypothetical protein